MHCSRSGSLESPSPKWHWKHGGSNSDGIIGLSEANWDEMVIFTISKPLIVKCACVVWYGQMMGAHSTRYLVVRKGQVLCRVCSVGHCVIRRFIVA